MKNFNATIVLLIILNHSFISAQETYYWNIQYGTRSTLLGGAVIGSVSDLSATYYNPGAIALFEDIHFILSARVYQYEKYTVEDGAGEGIDLGFSSVTPSPSFIAFDINFDFLGKDKLALSVLTRQTANFEFNERFIDSLDVIESSPGKEQFAGGVSLEKSFVDIWGGITYSTKLNELIGVGLTGYLAYISHRRGSTTILQALTSSDDIASFTDLYNTRFKSLRAIFKFGAGINLDPLTLGFSLTSPSLQISGSGSVGSNRFLSGVDSTNFQSNFQEDVQAIYINPLSIGFGGAYRFGKINLHFSTEWFNNIDSYSVIDSEPFRSQKSGELIVNDLTHESKSVINYGIGLDYIIRKNFILSGGFVTDFTAKIKNTETNLSPSASWDTYHITAGATFPIGGSETTLGISYSFGNEVFENTINIRPGSDNPITSNRETDVSYSRIKILFGFEL